MKPPRPREADPLPPPSEGSIEVDPWSLPPPEGGYETLDLDDPPAASPGAAGIPAADGGRAVPRSTAAGTPAPSRAEEERAAPAGGARPRGPVIAIAAAAVTLAGAAGAWLLRGGPAEGSGGVRVTATQDAQEAPWSTTPPLAPVDPSYVERRRRDEGPARAGTATPPAPRAPAPHGSRAHEADAPPAATTPEPVEAEVTPPPPPPAPIQEPPAPAPATAPTTAAAAADIPLPPPPVVAAPRPAATRARAPVLQTRTCVEDALRLPRGLDGRLPPELVARVQVGADGRPGEVSVPGPVDSRLAAAVTSAVRTCRFTPGTSGDGQPAAAPTTMRIRFE